jgi:carboxymethylenebutenolidase
MWNAFRTDEESSLVAGTMKYAAGGGDMIEAYLARPDGPGPYPAVVTVAHVIGWDEILREYARRWAAHGYIAMVPNILSRFGHGAPDAVSSAVRSSGGVADDSVVADCEAALNWIKALPASNGKVGIWGMCSAGRHATLVASRVPGFDVVGNLWGARVVMSPAQLNEKTPVAPIDLVPQLNAPMIGLFGNDDMSPSPAEVNQLEEVLKANGKNYVFYRYDGAGHGFFYYDRPLYRQQQAMDGWNKLEDFFNQYLRTAPAPAPAAETAPTQ